MSEHSYHGATSRSENTHCQHLTLNKHVTACYITIAYYMCRKRRGSRFQWPNSACYRFRSDCSYSLVAASAGGSPLLPPSPCFSPLTPSACYRFRSDCSYSLVPAIAGGPPPPYSLPPPAPPLTPYACYRFWSDCSYSLVPAIAGGPPLLPPSPCSPLNTLRLLPIPVGLLVLPCSRQCRRFPLLPPLLFFFLSRTEEQAKAGTCARDRRALQQLALNVHVKHSDLT